MRWLPIFLVLLVTASANADERRAAPPTFAPEDWKGVFFDSVDEAIRGERPSLSAIRQSAKQASEQAMAEASGGDDGGGPKSDLWASLISPVSIEDEIKRVRLHYDSIITTPGAFNSGGYLDARVDLTIMAVMFAIITEHSGEVRWKDQASAARDLLARTAFNCKAGSTQVYNEAKLRKADLQDLVSGTGLADREGEPTNDWAMIADRSPLMTYAESLIETLEDSTNNAGAINDNIDSIRRNAELLATLGEILVREGMEEADDDDYVKLSRDMTADAKQVVLAVDRADTEAIGQGVSAIRQRCDACHEQYR